MVIFFGGGVFLVRGGTFFELGDSFFFFTWGGGGSPLTGENKAFMAEPSDRPAINDRLLRKKGRGGECEKKKCEK